MTLIHLDENLHNNQNDREVLVRVENVSKKFCRSLKKSLWYGMQDIASEVLGRKYEHELRPDEFWSVKDVSFELRRGECLGLIGRNGAGKSTLLRMLNGLIKPDRGRIEIRGRVNALIALGAGFNPILTGRENIYVNASVLGLSKQEINEKIDEIIDFAEIGEFIEAPVQSYSSGMQVRLGFAVATALHPDVLILDEVLAVGDAAFRVKCFNRMHEVLKNAAVIFVSHSMPQITRICNHALLLQQGKVLESSRELGRVIARYHEITEYKTQPILQGSGKTKINSVFILNSQKQPVTSIVHGEPFYFLINVSLFDKSAINRPKILITISDGEENNIAQVYEEIKPKSLSEILEITLEFDKSLFNPGVYSLTVSLLIGDRGELTTVLRGGASFNVIHSISGYAPIWLHPISTQLN